MDKAGTWVDPLDVVVNGAVQQHAVASGVAFFDPAAGPDAGGVFIDTRDAPVMCPGTPTVPYQVLPTRTQPLPEAVTEWGSLLFNNLWIMNYPVWSLDSDFHFRFVLRSTVPRVQ